MLFPIASGPNRLRLDLGGGDTKDKLMIGGLALIIVVAIVALVMSVRGGGGLKTAGPEIMTFICAKCQHQWDMNREQRRQAMGNEPPGPMEERVPRVVCPKCGEKWGFRAAICPDPECGHAYLPNRALQRIGMQVQDRERCPKCGLDPMDWYREHPPKKRR